jgi:hypothetical protein
MNDKLEPLSGGGRDAVVSETRVDACVTCLYVTQHER